MSMQLTRAAVNPTVLCKSAFQLFCTIEQLHRQLSKPNRLLRRACRHSVPSTQFSSRYWRKAQLPGHLLFEKVANVRGCFTGLVS